MFPVFFYGKERLSMRGKNQKLKLLYLAKILQEQTDKDHMITTPQIIEELSKYEIDAQRKSIYDDLAALRNFGIGIEKVQGSGKTFYYCSSMYIPEKVFDKGEEKG